MPISLWPAILLVAAVSIWLSVIDLKTMRIPNRIVLPATLASLALVFIDGWATSLRSLLAALAAFSMFFLLNLVTRGQIGMGDAKLAALLAVGLGALGWPALLLGTSLGFVFGGVAASIKLLVSRGKNLHASFAYGPYLTAGALAVLVLVTLLG